MADSEAVHVKNQCSTGSQCGPAPAPLPLHVQGLSQRPKQPTASFIDRFSFFTFNWESNKQRAVDVGQASVRTILLSFS